MPGTRPLKVRELLAGKGTGLFHVRGPARPELSSQRDWQRKRRVTGQITDLAVHTKLGATSGVVWVTRLSDGKVVPGAALALYDAGGAVRWQGTSDADGLARVPGLAQLIPSRLGTGTSSPRLRRQSPASPWSPRRLGRRHRGHPRRLDRRLRALGLRRRGGLGGEAAPASVGFVTPERGIYRPGDTVMLKGMLRYRRLAILDHPEEGNPGPELTVSDSRGKEIFSRNPPALRVRHLLRRGARSIPSRRSAAYSVRASAEVPSGKVET